MPSTNQSNQTSATYASEFERFYRSSHDLGPLIKGIRSKERCKNWLGEANRLDAPVAIKRDLAERFETLQTQR